MFIYFICLLFTRNIVASLVVGFSGINFGIVYLYFQFYR